MSVQTFDYEKAKRELDTLLAWFDSENADITQSLAKFEQAKKLIEQLEAFLTDTEKQLSVKVASLDRDE